MPAVFELVQSKDYWLASGLSAQGSGTPGQIIANRHANFLRWYSASSNGPTAGGSSIYTLQHSHNGTAWTNLETVTAVKGTVGTAVFSGGYYNYLRVSMDKVYSAAQTGTGILYLVVQTLEST